jgi:hypothetical protein
MTVETALPSVKADRERKTDFRGGTYGDLSGVESTWTSACRKLGRCLVHVDPQKEQDLGHPPDSRQGVSVLIWRAWYGSSDYANAVPDFKGVRWKGVLAKIRELGVTNKYDSAYQAITEIEEGDIAGQHFTSEYLKPRLDILEDYKNSVLEPAIK